MRFSTQTNKILLFAGESRKAKMNTRKIGIIGCGNMGGAILYGALDIRVN